MIMIDDYNDYDGYDGTARKQGIDDYCNYWLNAGWLVFHQLLIVTIKL